MWYSYADDVTDLGPQLTSLVANFVVNTIINLIVLFNIRFMNCTSQYNLRIDYKYLLNVKRMISKENKKENNSLMKKSMFLFIAYLCDAIQPIACYIYC